MNVRRWLSGLIPLFAALLLVTGCTGDDSGDDGDSDGGDTSALQARLEAAQQQLTDAPAIDISLATDNLPDGITGLLSAKGRGYQGEIVEKAAFEGTVDVVTGGSSIKAEVVAVNSKVYAKTSLAPLFLTISPETLGAPDPATLLGAKDEGLASILVKTEDLTEDGKSRDGREVLTTINGTIPGEVINSYLPSADDTADFAVVYRLTDDDVLQDATITGPFYPGGDDVTYTVVLTASDDDSAIEPPERPGGE